MEGVSGSFFPFFSHRHSFYIIERIYWLWMADETDLLHISLARQRRLSQPVKSGGVGRRITSETVSGFGLLSV